MYKATTTRTWIQVRWNWLSGMIMKGCRLPLGAAAATVVAATLG
jgi:hypothetical protein